MCHTSHVTRHTSHITHHTSHITSHVTPGLRVRHGRSVRLCLPAAAHIHTGAPVSRRQQPCQVCGWCCAACVVAVDDVLQKRVNNCDVLCMYFIATEDGPVSEQVVPVFELPCKPFLTQSLQNCNTFLNHCKIVTLSPCRLHCRPRIRQVQQCAQHQ